MNEEFEQFLNQEFSRNKLNRLHKNYGGGKFFSTPYIGVSSGDDPLYQKYKEVVGPEHYTPAELWLADGLPNEERLASKLRVVSIVCPFVDEIRIASKTAKKIPAEIYSVSRNYANPFMLDLLRKIIKYIQDLGYNATAGMLSENFSIFTKGRFYSNFSERHAAFAAGLGTFSLHEGFITEVGCNVRFTSFITDAPFEVTPRSHENPYGNCLYYSEGTCRKCEERCPGDAITKNGHDKNKCFYYGQKVARKLRDRIGPILKPSSRRINQIVRPNWFPVGCAFCQFDVPCMDKNPTAGKQK